MAFPFASTDLRVRLDLDGSGAYAEDVTDYLRGPVEITRGLQSEGSTAGPASMSCTLDNSDHRFTRGNPTGPYYGLLQRNTGIRADLPHLITRLDVPLGVPNALSTPDTAALSVTGDIDLRIDVEMDDWQAGGVGCDLLSKWVETGDQRSWALYLDATGQLALHWSEDGVTGHVGSISSAAVPIGPKRQCLRATADVDNGSGGYTMTLYAGPAMDGPWTSLGEFTYTAYGTISIYDSTAPWAIGDTAGGGGRAAMRVFAAQIWDGIEGSGGTLVSDLDLIAIPEGASMVDDAQGNTWTPVSGSELQTRDVRYVGVVPSWSTSGGVVDEDSQVSIVAADVLRRLGRSKAILSSAYRTAVTAPQSPMPSVVAYWPMEVDADARIYPSGLPGKPDAHAAYTVSDISDSTSFPCSDPLPVAGSDWAAAGSIAGYTDTGEIQVFECVKFPAAGVSGTTRLFGIYCGGTAVKWEISVDSSGDLYLKAYASDGTTLVSSGPILFGGIGVNGRALRVGLHLSTNGSDVDWTYSILEVGESSGWYQSGTLTSQSIGRATWWATGQDTGLEGCTVGQVTVQSEVTSVFDLATQLNAYSGEVAGERIDRLAESVGMAVRVSGPSAVALGYQTSGRLIDIMREVESSDGGILYTPRERSGLAYRSAMSMTARDAVLSAPTASAGIAVLVPVDDDQHLRNRVQVNRSGGSFTIAELTSGALSTQDHPNGAGLYDEDIDVSLASDSQLPDWANWKLHMGTVVEPRFPGLRINLSGESFIAEAAAGTYDLAVAARDLDIGDRVTLTDPPAWAGVESVDQVAIGLQETIGQWEHLIGVVCRPYAPLRVGVWDQDRYTTDGTVLDGALSDSATTIPITNAQLVQWGHADGDYDIVIGGEQITVGGVSGTGTSQSLTSCIRSVNGVVKSHADGATVDLLTPYYRGL